MYFEALPQSAREAVNRVLEAETLISAGRPEPYNAFVLKDSRSTAISASGRVMAGWESVCGATETVARGSTGETDRSLKELACGRMAFLDEQLQDPLAYLDLKEYVE